MHQEYRQGLTRFGETAVNPFDVIDICTFKHHRWIQDPGIWILDAQEGSSVGCTTIFQDLKWQSDDP